MNSQKKLLIDILHDNLAVSEEAVAEVQALLAMGGKTEFEIILERGFV